ncbi:LysR family transcriptional regulator [Oceanospirillum sp. D5]|uniref:LysR family transcriptional regulator n=2 Tax=Oceanospirillum sediminis TaxID=2760088 RepID=A0A839IMN9_9GAMM|nr:LysR family transcriptional regulator [Oceanospirillum sediminis]
MNAKMQYKLTASDLEVLLAVYRGGTLAAAAERIGVDSSTIFRCVQKMERGIGQSLFSRSRSGYRPTELGLQLAEKAEAIEVELESARSAAQMAPEDIAGSVHITTTDTILHGLLAPQLSLLNRTHPLLQFELETANRLANLSRRDSDIALRATRTPPEHLIGKHLGPIRVALFASQISGLAAGDRIDNKICWIAPDEALPDHPSVHWRKRYYPKANVAYRVDSILTVTEFIRLGFGIGIIPLFLAEDYPDLVQLTDVLDECQTELWLLAHPESRHLRRVSAVFGHLSQIIRLE